MKLANEFGWNEPAHIRAFPLEDDNRSLSSCAPESVSQPYYEAVHAESPGLWEASAVMLGKSLEVVCRHFYPDSKSMFEGLNTLYAKGFLSKRMLDWGHDVRVLRNAAAHRRELAITESDVSVAFDFCRALIVILFEIDHNYAVYRQAKSKHETNE